MLGPSKTGRSTSRLKYGLNDASNLKSLFEFLWMAQEREESTEERLSDGVFSEVRVTWDQRRRSYNTRTRRDEPKRKSHATEHRFSNPLLFRLEQTKRRKPLDSGILLKLGHIVSGHNEQQSTNFYCQSIQRPPYRSDHEEWGDTTDNFVYYFETEHETDRKKKKKKLK